MSTTLFSASIFNFGPLWILAPMLLYLLLLVFSLFPFAQYKFSFAKSKGTLISFGYHATILDDGVINETTQNIRIFYVYNPLIDENVIVRIEQLIEAE